MNENPNTTPALLPERHPQELFVCDVADAVLKDDMASMEHPFYSLSKKPETNVRRYENKGKWLEIIPSAKGLATIYDKDILIYCISQIMAKMKGGIAPSPKIKIIAQDLLVAINRTTGGKDYEALIEALDRLSGTRIHTNITTGGEVVDEGFGLINAYRVRRSKNSGRIVEMTIELSAWVFNAIRAQEVLTLHRDYFRLRRPLERRVYEIARKHCGKQDEWKIGIDLLRKKCGSRASMNEFRRLMRELTQGNHLPDYAVSIDGDFIVFVNRGTMPSKEERASYPVLDPETYHDARLTAPGYDVYALEREWQRWWEESGCPELQDANRAFLGFCRQRHTRRPLVTRGDNTYDS
jgi:plasmid replication initiation protein